MRADPAVLLDGGEAAEDRVLADLDMAAEGRVVDQNDTVPDQAVMGDMGRDHQEAIRPDPGLAPASRGAAVDGGVLADDAVGPDDDGGRLALVARVLRRSADRREGVERGAGADRRVAAHHDMRMDDDVVLEHHVALDDRIRSDADAGADPRAVLDDRRLVDVAHRRNYSSAISALIVASATFTPPTIASALNFQMLVRLRILRT